MIEDNNFYVTYLLQLVCGPQREEPSVYEMKFKTDLRQKKLSVSVETVKKSNKPVFIQESSAE